MTSRLPIHALDPAAGSPGQVPTINAAGDALEYADPVGGATGAIFVPLTTTVGGTPQLVWDENDNLVMTEVPA